MRAIRTTTISILALGLLAGSAVGVAAQDEEPAPVTISSVSGTISVDGAGCGQATSSFECPLILETSDERLSGDGLVRRATGKFWPSVEDFAVVESLTVQVGNADGTWTGGGVLYSQQWAEEPLFGEYQPTWVLEGEDAYDGLTAVLRVDWGEEGAVGGVIFEGDLPAAPPLPE